MRGGILVLVGLSSCALVVDLDTLRGDASDASVSDVRTIKCKGVASCTPPGFCCGVCNNLDAGGCAYSFSCLPYNSSCNGNPIACSDQASCPTGQVCCALVGGNNTYFSSSSCKTLGDCTAAAPSMVLCDPNAKDPCAASGGQCLAAASGAFADLYECQ